ncbi:hypothetical protein LGM79_09945 [Burkholderia multivorans]|nr:hypothetical protein [Burkholderia multivorans]MDN7985656.1 hypothetical protein [Burkholderia multivorans]
MTQVQAVGIAWYKESDYDRCKALFVDGHKLPVSFLQWKDQAEQIRKRFVREGKVVVQAYIDPDTFSAWCASNGYDVDARGRMAFANAEAYRVVMKANNHRS